MRIGILHGWLLDGSGSNVYVRSLARALVERGHQIVLICQEPHPERFPGVGVVRVPELDRSVMPVYVADTRYEGFAEARSFVELAGDPRLERYLDDFTRGAVSACREGGVEVLHANHVYPMPEIARRVKEELGIPYLVFPHGSAIEYAVKKSQDLALAAGRAIDAADALVVGNEAVSRRIFRLFPGRAAAWKLKHEIVPVGVDPAIFSPVARADRPAAIRRLAAQALAQGGKKPAMSLRLMALQFPDDESLREAVREARREYEPKAPDAELGEKLSAVDWAGERIVLYFGKLLSGKGIHDLVAALPEILERQPRGRLVLVGEGPFREVLELLLRALGTGDRALLERIVRLGGGLEGGGAAEEPLRNVSAYLERLGVARALELGRRTRPDLRTVFTGYLPHALLRHLLPCADVAVFPSEVAEAYPLVLLEAISAGVLPSASYFEGLGDGLDAIAARLPPELGPLMRIAPEPAERVRSIAGGVGGLLAREPDWGESCRRLAVEEYAWSAVARRMEAVYARLAAGARPRTHS